MQTRKRRSNLNVDASNVHRVKESRTFIASKVLRQHSFKFEVGRKKLVLSLYYNSVQLQLMNFWTVKRHKPIYSRSVDAVRCAETVSWVKQSRSAAVRTSTRLRQLPRELARWSIRSTNDVLVTAEKESRTSSFGEGCTRLRLAYRMQKFNSLSKIRPCYL